MRFRNFPVGYFVLPALLVAVFLAARFAGVASAASGPASAAAATPDPEVDPMFVSDAPAAIDPQERLVEAAVSDRFLGRSAALAHEEFLTALSEHPYVEKVYRARYERRVHPEARYRLDDGLGEFRKHYRISAALCYPKEYFPVVGCLLEQCKSGAMKHMLVDNPRLRDEVDNAVLFACRR